MREKLLKALLVLSCIVGVGCLQAQSLYLFKRTGFDRSVSIGQTQSIDFSGQSFNLLLKSGETISIPFEEMRKMTFTPEETKVDTPADALFSLFPNPASEYLNVQFSAEIRSSNPEVIIRSIDGKVVYNERVESVGDYHTIQVSTWSSGVYLLFVRDGEQVHTQKFVKQ